MNDRIRLLVETINMALRHHANDLAAAIAFWVFFSIFPLLIGILAVAGHLLESAAMQARLMEALTEFLPGSAPLVRENIASVLHSRGAMGWVAIVGLLWSAGKGFGAITRAINRTLGAKRRHSFLIAALRQFLLTLAVTVLVTAAVGLPLVLEVVLEPPVLESLGLAGVAMPRLQGWALSFVLMFLVFALIYRMTPYVSVRWRDVFPGALFAAVSFELGKAVFVFYVDRFAGFESIYGPLTSIIVLLLWLYVSALILIIGAEYNIARWKAKAPTARDAAGADDNGP